MIQLKERTTKAEMLQQLPLIQQLYPEFTEQTFLSGVAYGEIRATSENVTFSNITAPAGFSINPDGTVNVSANALPGDYIFTYTLCPIGSTTGCVYDIIAYFTIYNTVRAIADVFNFDTQGNFLGSTHDDPTSNNILTNDGYAADCGFSAPNSFVGAVLGVNIGSIFINYINNTDLYFYINPLNGSVSGSGSPAGTYPFTYYISDALYPNVISTSYGWMQVLDSSRMINNKDKTSEYNPIIIAPNPFNTLFTIYFENNIKLGKIEVFDLLGQRIYELNVENSLKVEVDLSSIASGSYLVKIYDGKQFIDKLIIKK